MGSEVRRGWDSSVDSNFMLLVLRSESILPGELC